MDVEYLYVTILGRRLDKGSAAFYAKARLPHPRFKHRLLADPRTPGAIRVWCRVCVSAE